MESMLDLDRYLLDRLDPPVGQWVAGDPTVHRIKV